MSSNPFSLIGHVALVTGGTRGIGLESARALARAGASVAVVARTAEATKSVASDLEREFEVEVLPVVADIGHDDEIPGVVSSVVAKTALGRVGEAAEVAGAVAYLASAYTTGSILVVDGGTVA
ncbi:SDR family NAD(P)-dependent oxidoreductase [Lentzea kentuckyensis]|uniref:SDR family NAD(P)-dependent oxidoreductase n=1 Tax=Lentzea kentuckyensis TaxID=360086 RepID=UPI000A3CF233|nr:SDR family NAD(P)-dependent oxidoreductase [Lentzea kentuckyensis]